MSMIVLDTSELVIRFKESLSTIQASYFDQDELGHDIVNSIFCRDGVEYKIEDLWDKYLDGVDWDRPNNNLDPEIIMMSSRALITGIAEKALRANLYDNKGLLPFKYHSWVNDDLVLRSWELSSVIKRFMR